MELVLLVPVVLLALVLMVIAGRQVSAALITQDAAAAAARSASLQRDVSAARTHARAAAVRELADRGVVCAPFTVAVDTARFASGGPTQVEVACTVSVVDLGGFGGQRTLRATAVSSTDPHREQVP
ncbi:hypothetical protein KIK06_24785 [Nocardiopsis sp. EMB25]|uniref:hypothetical protein n=1 Tax=Nocardiopsis sp. EMB25 TaxID=2835867 RepID=UPI0022845B1B|nr:hypothetical protein [Nocardiopsis sp. EMB25]MCY9787105.1 hypothetical protein [Nocardiopsis sp. EMB25]